MTVPVESPTIKLAYSGPGDYSFGFKILAATDLTVTHTSAAGVVTTLAYGTQYTVTKYTNGGVVNSTFVASGGYLDIRRTITLEQPTNWVNNEALDMEILESNMDRIVMLIQQLQQEILSGDPTLTWRGTWVTGQVYYSGQIVTGPDFNVYAALSGHTAGVFATDLANGEWLMVLDIASASSGATDTFKVKATGPGDPDVWVDSLIHKVPAGAVMAYSPGYFTNGVNGGYVPVIGNDVNSVNAEVNPLGWYVANGAACNVAGSRFFNGAGRYLPNWSDSRFIFGYGAAGITGGTNLVAAHAHIVSTPQTVTATGGPASTYGVSLTATQIPPHTHNIALGFNPTHNIAGGTSVKGIAVVTSTTDSGAVGSGGVAAVHAHAIDQHGHIINAIAVWSNANADHENRPQFLSAFILIKVR